MHMEDPDLMPISPLNNTKLRNYLDDLKGLFYKDVRKVVHQYSSQITSVFGVLC